MEVSSLNSITALFNISRNGLVAKPFMFGRVATKSKKRHANAIPRKLNVVDCRAQASGITKVGSVEPETVLGGGSSKDENLVFVAGATGRVGSRTVRELLKLGFKVRAGVRNMNRAESLVQVVRQMKLDDATNGLNQSIEKLQMVECDLEKPDQIGPALGKASIVICCIGASEKEIFDITGPYRIDYMATKNIIDAGCVLGLDFGDGIFFHLQNGPRENKENDTTTAKVDHFILLTSLGTNKFGFPAAILNLFWGVLCWKRKAEEALIASGLPYTIVRPGGMERPTDSYKLTHNITLSEEDTLFGGQVSNLQVAELMAFMAKRRSISYCKVVEVIAETTAPLTPVEDLLAKIPSKRIEIDPPKESGDAVEPSPSVPEIKPSDLSTPLIVKENSTAKPALTRPLSPYTAYEDLKPPTTPSPTPSSKTGDFKANLETLLPVSDSLPSAVESISLEPSSIVTESLSLQKEGKHSSSPYPNFTDLKPPVSPTPSPPDMCQDTRTPEATPTATADDSKYNNIVAIVGDSFQPESLAEQQLSSRPLSPYTAYADLKPPSSPSPNPSGPKEESSGSSNISDNTIQITGGKNQANTKTSLVENDPPSSAPSNSPYQVYEDLKPPSSPSPNAPVISEYGALVPGQNPSVTQHESGSKEYTLSPFTMYEDLKPPSSPSPYFKEL